MARPIATFPVLPTSSGPEVPNADETTTPPANGKTVRRRRKNRTRDRSASTERQLRTADRLVLAQRDYEHATALYNAAIDQRRKRVWEAQGAGLTDDEIGKLLGGIGRSRVSQLAAEHARTTRRRKRE